MALMNFFTSPLVLLLVPGLPLLLAMGLMSGRLRRVTILFSPWAAFPALVVSLSLTPGITLELPWLLFGTLLGFDETARIFLFFTALLWLLASIYAVGYFPERSSRARFFTWFLLAMAGNLGLILAQDMVIFYTFFALMSLASYGLVIHERTSEALRAGRVYIVLAVVGEVLLFVAFALAALAADSIEFAAVRGALAGSALAGSVLAGLELRDWIIGLTLIGFGIKAGVIGLHVWLPLAHPVAPTPASAVLSGSMIAAGLLGWLRVLPLGETALIGWGGTMIIAGAAAVFYAVLVGLLQSNPKTVLAYSSISKMGIMTIAVGLGLIAPERWPFILSIILIYALSHGLSKGALFLGVGIAATPPVSKWRRRLLLAGLLLPALSLAGAPLTSGMIAKHLLKLQVTSTISPWSDWLQMILPWSAVATSILMARFLYLVWPRHKSTSQAQATPGATLVTTPATMRLSWLVLLLVVALIPWLIPLPDQQARWPVKAMISALWPIALGSGLAVCVWLAARYQWISLSFRIPPGDLLLMVEKRLCSAVATGRSFSFNTLPKWRSSGLLVVARLLPMRTWQKALEASERVLQSWTLAVTLFLFLGIAIALLNAV